MTNEMKAAYDELLGKYLTALEALEDAQNPHARYCAKWDSECLDCTCNVHKLLEDPNDQRNLAAW